MYLDHVSFLGGLSYFLFSLCLCVSPSEGFKRPGPPWPLRTGSQWAEPCFSSLPAVGVNLPLSKQKPTARIEAIQCNLDFLVCFFGGELFGHIHCLAVKTQRALKISSQPGTREIFAI